MSGFESFGGKKAEQRPASEKEEQDAENQLEELLNDPDNVFLTEIELNRRTIEENESAVKALAFARSRIEERLSKAMSFRGFEHSEVTLKEIDLPALKHTIDSILKNQLEIGRGGDAYVVVDKNEIRELPPEICYKFALEEATPRGRNSTSYEAELQGMFYDTALEKTDSKIGVPMPFYCAEFGSKKMIAMEKLGAKSIDDIKRGKGSLPEWLDVEEFCQELKSMLDHLHEHDLYHRDMHFGNVMITQKPHLEEGDKWGYIIDFGLSGVTKEEEFAYKKHVAGIDFTYSDDYGMIKEARLLLNDLKSRSTWK
jgi:serine/threonine protein kinase